MTALHRDDKFRFTLQWGTDTQEKIAVGTLLEQLGNKKSYLVIVAVMEYIQRHPEIAAPGAEVKIAYQPTQTREQLMEMVKTMTKAAVEELLAGKSLVPAGDIQQAAPPAGPSDQDLDTMLAGLKFFDM